MINYYFGGKIGILKEIINQAYEKHLKAITEAHIELPTEEHIYLVIKNYIDFFRKNTELALVAFDFVPFDISEINDLKKSWVEKHMELLKQLFDKLGLDPKNKIHTSLFSGFLGNIILTHFRRCYSVEMATHEPCIEYSDEFYRKFTQTLTNFYLSGVKGVVTLNKKAKKKH